MKPEGVKSPIRGKFIGILVLAGVIPVCIALLVFETLGYRSYREAMGHLQEARAQHLAQTLGDVVRKELESLDDFIALSSLHERLQAAGQSLAADSPEELKAQVAEIESRWPKLSVDDPLIQGVLSNELSKQLIAFRSRHRMFAEIFITDTEGSLVAATRKTSDFWQADEEWWQRGAVLGPRKLYVEGIQYDDSAGVYSLDVSVPIRDPRHPLAPPAGVLKGVINASPLFSLTDPTANGDTVLRQVVVPDGRILATLSSPYTDPLHDRITDEALRNIASHRRGWLIAEVSGSTRDLAGFAPLVISGTFATGLEIVGATPMHVLVRQPASVALAPAEKQILWMGLAGAVCLFGFIVAGYAVATRKLINPIENLREAVRRIAGSVKIDRDAAFAAKASGALEPLRQIQTRDELEDLARDFGGMAQRVLGYNEQLEREIAEKTAEISRDLQLAREFQEALMPQSFPKIPSEPWQASLSLGFRHLYKPASSVGGDFFDVVKLDDHRAGVFIADVMGHGARSALVTAILRALLQNLAADGSDPGRVLAKLNSHFYNTMRNSGETIFVSAFYLVLDTQSATVRFASAGHPAPFVARRSTGEVEELIQHLHGNPALGILAETTYQQWTQPVKPGDVFILFTDGVHEAYNCDGEEFGLERVRKVIREQMGEFEPDIPAAIVAALLRFIAPAVPADDICIVALEANGNQQSPAPDSAEKAAVKV